MKEPKVLLYQGGRRLVAKSGVGSAISHQETALKAAKVTFLKTGSDWDVVHLNTVFPDALWKAYRAKKKGKKVIYHGHSTMEDFRNSFTGSNFLAPVFKKWICMCYSQGDLILTPTLYSGEILKSYGLKPPILALSNGVDTDFFKRAVGQKARFRKKYGLSMKKKVVLSVGLPIERKGILDFIRMARRHPEYEFFWFGGTNSMLIRQKVKKAMKEAPSNCHFPGFVGKEELRDAYGGSDAFLFFSTEETEGIVLLEALAMELPIVARNIGAYKGWLTDGENSWLKEDFGDMEKYLVGVLNGKLLSLTENGRKTANKRNLKAVGLKLATIYKTLYNEEVKSKGEMCHGIISYFNC